MPSDKILFLGPDAENPSNDAYSAYRREFVRNGALFLDHRGLYLRLGHRGAQDFIRRFVRDEGVATLVFANDPLSFDFDLGFFVELSRGVYTAMLAGDTVYYFGTRDKYYARAMDLVIVNDSFETPAEFRALGVDSLVFTTCCDREKYVKREDAAKTIDVSFVGALSGREERTAYLDFLAANGVAVSAFGQGTPGGRVTLDRMVEIFNQSRINLNFTDASVVSPLAGTAPPAGAKQIKGRIAEAAICGSFVLTESAPGVENVLAPDKEMAVFGGKEDLLEKVRYYLAHEREREAVAAAGYRRAVVDYDVRLAIPRLIAELERRRRAKTRSSAAVATDAAFETNFGSYRLRCVLRFLKRFRFGLAWEELRLLARTGRAAPRQFRAIFIEEVVDPFPRFKRLLKRLLGRGGR
ncbi:MAG: glycosyltransferase family 1 protein [Elusimicrobia bacterium]|nr:glycosyltransferase family 1 protein [Elusimicrobiota bacterium]